MKSLYFKRNYKGNLLKKHPQPRYETAPGLEIFEFRILKKNHEANLLKNTPSTAPGLKNHEIHIFEMEL